MLFLLDSNVLIDANRDYYALDRVPEFWDWLLHHADGGRVKMPLEMIEEVQDGNDDVAAWLKADDVEARLLLDHEPSEASIARIVEEGYAPDLTDEEIPKLGRDPFLIAAALEVGGCVVTTEVSRPRRQRANRHIPDVCAHFEVDCCDTYELTRRLDFRTSWKAPLPVD